MEKTLQIDGKAVRFKSTAAIPYLYRHKFGKDFMMECARLQDAAEKAKRDGTPLEISDLEMFERITYIMNKHADANVPDDMETWLEGFETFSIYEILPEILELWRVNQKTTVRPAKK